MTHEEPELLVADSFRVRAHPESGELEVRNLHAHFARFKVSALDAWQSTETQVPELPEEIRAAARSAIEIAGMRPPDDNWPDDDGSILLVDSETPAQCKVSELVETFLADVRQQLVAFGVGWPRLELWGVPAAQQTVLTDQQLRLSLRHLPELSQSLEARTADFSPIDHRDRKGPNIARYAQLNQELGAEALLTTELGQVVEGATTSLVWWQDGTLCVSQDGGRVPSVTEYALRDFAVSRGVTVHQENEFPTTLAKHEVWAVNALHGIRTVTTIDGVPLPLPDEDRLLVFQAALDATWQPVRPTLN